jgi:hypothetical protein
LLQVHDLGKCLFPKLKSTTRADVSARVEGKLGQGLETLRRMRHGT